MEQESMPKYVPQLRNLLDMRQKAREASHKMFVDAQMGKYLNSQALSTLENEIAQVHNMREVQWMLGAHPRGVVYDLVYARKLGLMGQLPIQPASYSGLDNAELSRSQ